MLVYCMYLLGVGLVVWRLDLKIPVLEPKPSTLKLNRHRQEPPSGLRPLVVLWAHGALRFGRTWRFAMGSYKYGYKSPDMGSKL